MKPAYFNWLRLCKLLLSIVLSVPVVSAQNAKDNTGLLFYQLNTSHGLSDNYIHDMAIDSSGNLWVGSGEGLNLFNGKTVVRYFASDYPQLESDFMRQLVCDQHNRVWVMTSGGYVTVIDEERRFHKVRIHVDSTIAFTRKMIYTPEAGLILFTRNGHYGVKQDLNLTALDSLTEEHFDSLHIAGFDTLLAKPFYHADALDNKCFLFMTDNALYKVNYKTQSVEQTYMIPNALTFCAWDENSALATDRKTGRLGVIDLGNGMITYPFDNLYDQHDRKFTAEITNAAKIGPDQYLFTARKQGIFLYNRRTNKLISHRHVASDPSTIANNYPSVIAAEKNGWVFLGVTPNGVSYFKSDAVIGQQSVFSDTHGNSYDGGVGRISTLDNDTYYLCTSDHLLKWKRSVNQTTFIDYNGSGNAYEQKPLVLYTLFDAFENLWVASAAGIYVLDKQERVIAHISDQDVRKSMAIPSLVITGLYQGADGNIWVTSHLGVCRINPQTYVVDRLEHTRLSALKTSYCYEIWMPDADNVWVTTTSRGAWHYTFSTDSVQMHTVETGMPDNHAISINSDRLGNIYIGTVNGMHILLTNGQKKNITIRDGLLNKRIEVILCDKKNRMWLGNDVGLACFNIADTSLRVFDERYGLSVHGFRIGSYNQNSDDELLWGTERGIQYFYPDKLYDQRISLPTTIHRVETRDLERDLTMSTTLELGPSDNYVTFYFSSIDYSKHLRTFYQYKLEGIDEDWVRVVDENSVRYSSLPAGTYTFRVKASNDDVSWEDAGNEVTIVIAQKVWNQWWFRIGGLAILSFITWKIWRHYRKTQMDRQDELETQVVINYFASRINSYRKTDDLLWDVVENCISKLHFEDCVIYLLDPGRKVLVQKAAFGPKMDREVSQDGLGYLIKQPLEIPLSTGIVGSVATQRKAELIPDTSADPRYIVDDQARNSELAVPMIIDGQAIGVIDSEHSRKHFFTQKHMNILSTIATLCANQIQRLRAEEEKQQAMIEVLQNKQKVTESRLQSLRLQMNPHFLFNALNSIQQMILANEEMVATRYLSRFSKLLRTILVHSDKEFVTLKEELDILRLYVDLEAVRFKDAFRYDITCDEDIDVDEVKIPTLLIQPFVENAIWHGLMHKEGDRLLTVNFYEEDDILHCDIEDNGIGREKARELKLNNGQGKDHVSKGIAVSMERLKAMTGSNGHSGVLEIIDMRDGAGVARGTRVEIRMPIQN